MRWIRAAIALFGASVVLLASCARVAPDPASGAGSMPTALKSAPFATTGMPEPLRDAAEAGDAEAMNEIGVAQMLSARTPSDYSMALYWLQKAIDGGSANAMYNLARMYLHGVGIARDYVNAFKWFGRSAQGGCVHGMHVFAVMAEKGLGTTRDPPLARAMYREAAWSGIPAAMLWVSEDLARGAVEPPDLVEAHAWLQVASQLDLDEQRQILVLAKMEALGSQLGPDHRDDARARAARIVVAIRNRLPGDTSLDGPPARPSPRALAPPVSTGSTQAQPQQISAGERMRDGRAVNLLGTPHAKDPEGPSGRLDAALLAESLVTY